MSMVVICPTQLTPNMWIFIIGFYSAYILAGVAPTAEFFHTSFSQLTQKNEFLYFVVKPEMKGFCETFLSKVFLDEGLFSSLPQALRVTFNVPDHAPLPPPAIPATSSDQLPFRPPAPAADPVVVSGSLEEDEVARPLLRKYLLLPGLSSYIDSFVSSILTWAAHFRTRHPPWRTNCIRS
ncbi:hypothetical protein LIER_04865 [Lithospermum erythrorhizon]|uniref:Uncharacterized protein n=1 Tax=Lithospermum erythrorhizon TaxID=34254 RepID=A0AAV3P2Y3_LITER